MCMVFDSDTELQKYTDTKHNETDARRQWIRFYLLAIHAWIWLSIAESWQSRVYPANINSIYISARDYDLNFVKWCSVAGGTIHFV